jgi:hypothetical protein
MRARLLAEIGPMLSLLAAFTLAACDVSSTVGFTRVPLSSTSCSDKSPIAACDTGPCVATTIGQGERGSWAVAADDRDVFFERIPTVLAKVPIGGGTVRDVRTDLDRIWMTATDAEYVYTTEYEAGVRRVKKSGGASELVMDPMGHPSALAVDADNVYVTMTEDDQIAMAPKAGGQPTLLAGQSAPVAIVVDDRHVYWVNQGPGGAAAGTLMRAPLGDLTDAEALLSGLDSPNALGVGNEDVFFAAGARIFRVAKAGGEAELFADDYGPVKTMVAYRDTVYLAGMTGFARARAGAATEVLDPRGTLGIAMSCQGVFATGWFESFLVQFNR